MNTTKIEYLGWANDWKEDPPIVVRCRQLGHQVSEENLDPSHHGLETMVTCHICGYSYRVDSSD